MRFLTLLLLLLALQRATAQHFLHPQDSIAHSAFGQIYRISGPQAAELLHPYPEKNAETERARRWAQLADTLLLCTPIDTFQGQSPRRPLPPGAYVLLRAQGEHLLMELLLTSHLTAYLRNNPRALEIAVYDSLAQPVRNARVLLDGQPIAFDPRKDAYLWPKHRKGGLLEIYADGQATILQLEQPYKHFSRRKRNYRQSYSPAARVFAAPRRWAFVAKSYVLYPFSYRARNTVGGLAYQRLRRRSARKAFHGYMAFSQPRYLPGDTLEVKAYIADKKGRPRRKPVDFMLEGAGKQLFKQKLAPNAPGNFVFKTVLNDSLQLDQYYDAVFYDNKLSRLARRYDWDYNDTRRYLSRSFRYEDYQLNTVTYTLAADRSQYKPADSVRLYLTALDANRQPIPAVSVRLLAFAQQVYPGKEPLYVPDTLWQLQQALSGDSLTTLTIPAGILPAATTTVGVTAFFINNAGEMQRKSLSFQITPPQPKLELLTHNGQELKIFWTNPDQSSRDTALLTLRYAGGRLEKRRVQLPYRTILPPSVAYVWAQSGAYTRENNLWGYTVSLNAERINDTILVKVGNPDGRSIHYRIEEDRRRIAEGVIQGDSLWQWQKSRDTRHQYDIELNYMHQGQETRQQEQLSYFENELLLELEQPASVAPGASAQVRVRARDTRKRPAAKVNLTALAINAQFGGQQPFEAPEVDFQGPRLPFEHARFSLSSIPEKMKKGVAPIYSPVNPQGWYQRLALDSFTYYQSRFRLAENKAWIRRDTYPADDSLDYQPPQFSAFIIREGRSLPVHLLYCNKDLEYSSVSNNVVPYSFYGDKGKNEIIVRTPNAQYHIQGVKMHYGEKIDFAIQDVPGVSSWSVRAGEEDWQVSRVPMPDSFTLNEQKLLFDSYLLWRAADTGGVHFFWQGRYRIQLAGAGTQATQFIGPFRTGDTKINYLNPGKFLNAFEFEPGFQYILSANRDRLYQAPDWMRRRGRFRPTEATVLPGMLAWRKSDIRADGPKTVVQTKIQTFRQNAADQRGKASLVLRTDLPQDSLACIALQSADSLIGPFNGKTGRFDGLTPGAYTLRLYTQSERLQTMPVRLRGDTTLYVFLSKNGFAPAPAGQRSGDLFHLDTLVKVIKLSDVQSRFLPFNRNAGESVLVGTVKDQSGEALIGASVRIMQGGIIIKGCVTDFNGKYRISLPSGAYTVEVAYTGYTTQQLEGVQLWSGLVEELNATMGESSALQEVLVMGYAAPLVQQSATVSAKLTGRTAGVQQTRAKKALTWADSVKFTPPIVQKDEEKAEDAPEPPPAEHIRRNFKDHAYWQPNLQTDRKGEAVFEVKFPDNITSWNSYVIGMDRKRRAGVAYTETRAFLPLSAQLGLPRFALAGDRFEVAGLATNLTEDSVGITTAFYQDGRLLQEKQRRIGGGFAEYLRIEVPQQQQDSLRLEYRLRSEQFQDGEARSIGILPVGTEEVVGNFWVADRDSQWTYRPLPEKGMVEVLVMDNTLDLLFEDVKYLANYPFGCNEQTSSRLVALLLSRKIAEHRPENAIPKVEREIKRCLTRLAQTQSSAGNWGWWQGDRPSAWMSIYVLRALCMAEQEGFKSTALPGGLTWLRANLDWLQPSELSDALLLLRACGVNVDCREYLDKIKPKPAATLNERLSHLRLQQLCGQNISPDSLMQHLKPTNLGGLYCGNENYDWYNRRASNTLLAYDIAEAAGWKDISRRIRFYWLRSRTVRPRNTIETAQILVRLMPDSAATRKQANISINGRRIESFPARLRLSGEELLRFSNNSDQPVFLSATQRWFNPQPVRADSHYVVGTTLIQGDGPVRSGQLRRGEAAQLEIIVEAKAGADYVMIEAPIPASCSYNAKPQGYSGHETWREYFRDRTVIFCRHLPPGQHRFVVDLQPRFSGEFTLNPARVEQMYFPVFYGHNGVEKVQVE